VSPTGAGTAALAPVARRSRDAARRRDIRNSTRRPVVARELDARFQPIQDRRLVARHRSLARRSRRKPPPFSVESMRDKVVTASEAAQRVASGATIAITGSGGGLLEADVVFAAIERRFLATGAPRDLTLVHALGIGDRGERGTNRFAHRGLVRRVIGGHWGWSPRMQALARDNAIEAYAFPSGAISHLLREIGAGRPGLFTHVGLGTFVDPRVAGGRVNDAAREELVEIVSIDGRRYLRYKPFRVDVGIVRGTLADAAGNVSPVDEPVDLDAHAVALAAHNSGGFVVAQVRATVPARTLAPRSVRIPGVLVDAVVVAADQMQTYRTLNEPAFAGYGGAAAPAPATAAPDRIKRVIARRAALELEAGATLNFGYGASALVATMIAERGELDRYRTTIEQGIHGGRMLDDDLFGAAYHPDAIVDSLAQMDFYSGGGLDIAFLGMAEMDGEGNVNVSRIDGAVNGPGGFIDISQNAKKVVFCGTFDGKGSRIDVADGRMHVARPGTLRKLVRRVAEVTFSGAQARERGQRVLYVTERATFALVPDGVELVEVAPGVDVRRDVLEQMDFAPLVRDVKTSPATIMQ
jgi:acyl CoA:acetate/3-ketoacid CoA transferase